MIKTLILGICPYENGLIIPIPIRWVDTLSLTMAQQWQQVFSGYFFGELSSFASNLHAFHLLRRPLSTEKSLEIQHR